jgi:hypothetical protein
MSDQPNQRDQARQQRLRAALRENLKRRKAQARARAADPGSHEADGPEPQSPVADER